MLAYLETSVLLSILFEEPQKTSAISQWKKYPHKITSNITEVECYNNLYKAKRISSNPEKESWLIEKKAELAALLGELKFKVLDSEVVGLIKTNENLAENRTLDAIHVGTAYFLALNAKEPITMVSFDKEINKSWLKLGFNSENPS